MPEGTTLLPDFLKDYDDELALKKETKRQAKASSFDGNPGDSNSMFGSSAFRPIVLFCLTPSCCRLSDQTGTEQHDWFAFRYEMFLALYVCYSSPCYFSRSCITA